MNRILAGGVAVGLSLAAVACGGGGGGGGGTVVKAHWLYTGPQNDGGYNQSMEPSQAAMDGIDGVETTATFEVPYSNRATQIASQAVAQGRNLLVDTLGLGNLFLDVCRQNTDVKCIEGYVTEKPPANTASYSLADWNLNYASGVAAGLMTKTNTLGFIGSFDVPLIRSAANSYTLGCQSVNPACKVRVVNINSYFDPPKEADASRSLIDAGADVLRAFTDSPTACQVAQDQGVYATGEYVDLKDTCPNANIVSTIWNFSDYFTKQTQAIKDGTFKGGTFTTVKVGDGEGQPHLGDYGDFVPNDVRQQTDKVWSQLVDGQNLVAGPIYNQAGQLMFKKGEVPSDKFLVGGWDWYVRGVTAR